MTKDNPGAFALGLEHYDDARRARCDRLIVGPAPGELRLTRRVDRDELADSLHPITHAHVVATAGLGLEDAQTWALILDRLAKVAASGESDPFFRAGS